MKKTKLLVLALASTFALSVKAQIKSPQPSPTAEIEQTIGLTNVEIEYSRPGKKGREIFGKLVPYGEIWRTGANASTKIKISDDIKVNGKELKKGEYALYTIGMLTIVLGTIIAIATISNILILVAITINIITSIIFITIIIQK